MVCPECKLNLSDDSKYCVRCGHIFIKDIDIEKEEEKRQLELLQEAYVGKRYKLIYDSRISVFYFWGGPFYAFYKKCYNIGILYSVIVIACSCLGLLVGKILSYGLFIILHLYYSFTFNHEYKLFVEKK